MTVGIVLLLMGDELVEGSHFSDCCDSDKCDACDSSSCDSCESDNCDAAPHGGECDSGQDAE